LSDEQYATLLKLASTPAKIKAIPAPKGEVLFTQKCASCHSTTRPKDMSTVIAPALVGVMHHLKMTHPDKSKSVAFIKDYALNPSEDKAICMPEKIKRFGLMPSQKGNVTEEELEVIANWMFDNFPPKDFKGMGQGKGHGQKKHEEKCKSDTK